VISNPPCRDTWERGRGIHGREAEGYMRERERERMRIEGEDENGRRG
jgi:hypothetical protein